MEWMTAGDALAMLCTQPQTLYANVSRGRIRAMPDPSDNRKSLYRGEDVRRLAQRAIGRRKQETVAAQAMQWGEPILRTAISTVRDDRLIYRGHDAIDLSRSATLDEVAELLWQFPLRLETVPTLSGIEGAFLALAQEAARSPCASRFDRQFAASAVMSVIAQAIAGQGDEPLHARLAKHWHRPQAAEAIRSALVLLADHELNPSTFAARVTVSTGASLWAGALAALATLRGPRHGLASPAVSALADDIDPLHAEPSLREWIGEGRHVPGIGHPLYPEGDPRAAALLAAFEVPPAFIALRQAARRLTADEPNIDFALAALTACYDLPPDAGISLFALARTVGWIAHMLEQIDSGEPIRPRARYIGPA